MPKAWDKRFKKSGIVSLSLLIVFSFIVFSTLRIVIGFSKY